MKFIQTLPMLIEYAKKIWETISEIITIENEEQIQKIAKEHENDNKINA